MKNMPAFMFYPSEFLADVFKMTKAEIGMYILLICDFHRHGPMTRKDIERVCGDSTDIVIENFEINEEGKYYHEKSYIEMKKRLEFCESRAKNAMGGKRAKAVQAPKGEGKPRAEKRPYGSKGNVYLTDEEYGLLKEKFGDTTDDRIEALSLYMLSKNREYGSHYATIMGWEVNNEIRKKEEKNRTRDYSDYEEMEKTQGNFFDKYLQSEEKMVK